MSNLPAKPFSNGTEYEIFLYNYCENCRAYKVRDDGFPEFPEFGGCPILDKMEYARFDDSEFPTENIRELRDADTDQVIRWHECNRFDPDDVDLANEAFTRMSKAVIHGFKRQEDE